MTRWHTLEETAGLLGIYHGTVREMIHKGDLKASLIGGGRGKYRISDEQIEEYLKNHSIYKRECDKKI